MYLEISKSFDRAWHDGLTYNLKRCRVSGKLLSYPRFCRLCGAFNETVERLVAGCMTIANSEKLARHNRALMVMAIAWAKEYGMVEKKQSGMWKIG